MRISSAFPQTPRLPECRFPQPSLSKERVQKISKFVYEVLTLLLTSPVYICRIIQDRVFHTDSMLQLAVWQGSTLALKTTLFTYHALGIHTEGFPQQYVTDAIQEGQDLFAAWMIKTRKFIQETPAPINPVQAAVRRNHIDLLRMLVQYMPDSTK